MHSTDILQQQKDLSHMTRGWRIVLVLYHQCTYKIKWNSHFNKLPIYKPFKNAWRKFKWIIFYCEMCDYSAHNHI
jgi:hypothetical protein